VRVFAMVYYDPMLREGADYACVAEPCPVCAPCPCADDAALDVVDKARKALDAAAKK
jgi:hypothetical protein